MLSTNQNLVLMPVNDLSELLQNIIETAISKINPLKVETPSPESDLIKINDVCQLLQVSRACIIKWQAKGKIKVYRYGRRSFYKKSEVLATLNGGK